MASGLRRTPTPTQTVRCVAVLILAAGCARPASRADEPAMGGALADSIILERTPCFGTCPAYRLRLSRDGHVLFESRNPREPPRTASDTVPDAGFVRLLGEAERIGFDALPERIDTSSSLCPVVATDHPSVTTTIVTGAHVKRVEHYTGCYGPAPDHAPVPELVAAMRFYALIDSVAGAARWIRPAQPRRMP
jgi:hypothetical protein